MDVRILVFDKITKVEQIKSIDLKFSVTEKELASLAMEDTPSRQTVKYWEPGVMEIIVSKNRNGSVGTCKVSFDPSV